MENKQSWWQRVFGKRIEQKSLGPMSLGLQVVNGNIISSGDNKESYIRNSYNVNDLVSSAANLIVDKVRIAPWAVYKITDKSSLKKYQALMSQKDLTGSDLKEALKLRKKALVPYTKDERLNTLLDYPNDYCTFSDLVAESSLFKMLTGDRFLWAEKLSAGANEGKPFKLWILPSHHVSIVASRTFPVKKLGYRMDSWGLLKLDLEAVMHDRFPNPNYNTMGDHLYGQSPLKSAMNLNDMIVASTLNATASFHNGGPKQIIWVDSGDRWNPEDTGKEALALKNILQGKEYAGPRNSNKLAASGYKVGAVPLGLSPVELEIIEAQKWGLRRVCNILGGIPSQLLNDPENKTYNNQKEGEKALTTRGALPYLNSFRDAFNRMLYDYWGYKDQDIYIDYDATVYSELQDDNKEKWGWVRELPVSWGYKLDLMGLDYEKGQPGLDEVMIPTGFQPIDSFDVEQALNDNPGNQEDGDDKVPAKRAGKNLFEGTTANGVHKELI